MEQIENYQTKGKMKFMMGNGSPCGPGSGCANQVGGDSFLYQLYHPYLYNYGHLLYKSRTQTSTSSYKLINAANEKSKYKQR
jgi:hypothetical protein